MNKELYYYGLFNSYNYFPKPNKYVMEINDDGKIIKTTLEGIVIHFTNSIDSLDYNSLNNFFITYRSFAEVSKLLDILLYRFKWSIKSSLDLQFGDEIMDENELIKIYNVIIVRTFIILRHWINNYIIEDFLFNNDVLYYFTSFIQNDLYRDVVSQHVDKEQSNNLKIIINCITNLKKIWISKYNQCFDYPHYHTTHTSNDYYLKYNIIINNNKAKKHLSAFALNYSTDPSVRNKSFLNIVGNDINLTKTKNSILFPNNSMMVNQNNSIQNHNTTFSRISHKSHSSGDSKNKIDFVQSLVVPETSKIDAILPSSPTKNLEFAINVNDLKKNGIGARDSIYGLLNKWNGADANTIADAESNSDKVLPDHSSMIGGSSEETTDVNTPQPSNVSKFVRYVFSIGKSNNEDDLEDDFQLDGCHKFDILSARSIDEVQFITNNENLDQKTRLNASITSDDSNYNKMDNLNLYNKVLQITNSLSQKNLSNVVLPQTSPKKDNFTTSPFLRSIEKTKTQINNRDWATGNKSNELIFSSQHKSMELKDLEQLEVEDEREADIQPISPTRSKHRSSYLDNEHHKIALVDDTESIPKIKHISLSNLSDDDLDEIKVSPHRTPKRVQSPSSKTLQRGLSFTKESKSPSIKNYQSVYSNLKQELPKARNTGRISVGINNRHVSMHSNGERAKSLGLRVSNIGESKEALQESSPDFKDALDEMVDDTKSIDLNGNISRNVSTMEKKIIQDDDVFRQKEDKLNELSQTLSNSNLKKRSLLTTEMSMFNTEHIVTTKNDRDVEQISVNSSVDSVLLIQDHQDDSVEADVPKRFTVGLDFNMDDEVVLKDKNTKKTDLREMFKNQMNDNSSGLSFMIYSENEEEVFDDIEDDNPKEMVENKLDANLKSFIKEENIETEDKPEEYVEQEEFDYEKGDNPLDIAMRKLEGTFEESDAESNLSSKSTKIEDIAPVKKTIVKSQTMHNLSSNLKRQTMIQNRRQTLLSTTNLSSTMDHELSSKKGGSTFTSPKKLVADPNSVYYIEQQQPQFNPNNYINDLLLNYTIKDKTLLIQNCEEHIPFILMYSSRDIAEQLTLIERDVLNEVDWKSLLQLEMNENLVSYTSWLEVLINQDSLSGVDLGIARFNLTVDWIISEIVLTKDVKLKRNALQKFIHVAEHCIQLQNFNTSMQIVLALSSTEVQHFKDSWRLVEPGDMLSWAEMKNLFSSEHDDYKLLRELMDDMDPIKGCLPFLVLYLSDLKNLNNMSTFFHSNHDIINYKKFDSLSTIVKNFIQRVNWGIEFYTLTLNQQLLSKCLYISSLQEWEITELLNDE